MYSLFNPKRLAGAILCASALAATPLHAASSLSKIASEYRILPSLPGDQVQAQLAFSADGGYLAVQDNSIDGNGLGIRARKFYGNLSAAQNTFLVNSATSGDQQNPRVALLKGGGAVFAWESSTSTGHRVFIRFLNAQDVFIGDDIAASRLFVGSESDAAIAVLSNGNVVVVWAEWDRDGSMDGIFGQVFLPTGSRTGGVFQVNQWSNLSQRTPHVAALEDGKFVVSWITDEHPGANNTARPDAIDIYARLFNPDSTAASDEFPVNVLKYHVSDDGSTREIHEVCANPFVAAVPGGFRAAWSERPSDITANDWDVKTRTFDLQGEAASLDVTVNNTTQGDQFSPRIASAGGSQLIVWTSFGQDGSDEGIYGRVLNASGDFDGDEFLVNTRTIGKQIFPTVSGAGDQKFVVAWSSFVGGLASYDLFAQNYALVPSNTLLAPTAPFASALSQTSICVTWAQFASDPGTSYLVYVDDENAPTETTQSMLTVTRPGWQPASTHTVRLAYKTGSGQSSPQSSSVSVTTWGADLNGDGLPDDWQQVNFGKLRPGPNEDTDGDGATNLEEFLAGTDPTDPASVLRTQISAREQGLYIEWNTVPGNYYQLQVTADFSSWTNIGTPRFASSTTDSLPCTGPGQVRYYRVIRMR